MPYKKLKVRLWSFFPVLWKKRLPTKVGVTNWKEEGRRKKVEGIEGVNLYFLPTEVGVTKNSNATFSHRNTSFSWYIFRKNRLKSVLRNRMRNRIPTEVGVTKNSNAAFSHRNTSFSWYYKRGVFRNTDFSR
jgi:hypothetical protein